MNIIKYIKTKLDTITIYTTLYAVRDELEKLIEANAHCVGICNIIPSLPSRAYKRQLTHDFVHFCNPHKNSTVHKEFKDSPLLAKANSVYWFSTSDSENSGYVIRLRYINYLIHNFETLRKQQLKS